MDPLIQLLVLVVIFAVAIWGAHTICAKFGFPQPVVWIVGAVLLIALLNGAAEIHLNATSVASRHPFANMGC